MLYDVDLTKKSIRSKTKEKEKKNDFMINKFRF